MAKKNQATGNCRYCGQSMIIHLPEGWDPEDREQEEFDMLATAQCECDRAVQEAERNEKKEKAIERMAEYYDEQIKVHAGDTERDILRRARLERQKSLMINVICNVADRMIAAAAVQIAEQEVFQVAVKTKGDLQIKRTFKGSEEWIF